MAKKRKRTTKNAVRFFKKHKELILDILRPTLIVVLVIVLLTNLIHFNSGKNYGIDVSEHQGRISWSKVRNDEVSFAIIRAGVRGYKNGKIAEDKYFKRNMFNSKFQNIHRGVYFYSQAVNKKEAIEEANWVLDKVGNAKLEYPIYIDVEDTCTNGAGRADGLSAKQRTEVVKAFCLTVEKAGYKAGIYSNAWFLKAKLNMSELSGYSVWLAEYVSGSEPVYWKNGYDLWQYTSEGSVPGINGNVDIDRYQVPERCTARE